MKKYRHLSFEDRVYIEVWFYESKSLSYMASRLGVHPSTISRELKRGSTGWLDIGYRADLGEKYKRKQSKKKGRKLVITGDLKDTITKYLEKDWSPEQISGRMKKEKKKSVSHETIYKFVKLNKSEGGQLYKHLRWGHRRRKKRFSVPRVRADILARRHISTRPKVIEDRKREGDWERDLVFGDSRSAAMLTFVDRKTLLTRIAKVESKSSYEIERQTIRLMKKELCRSITNDNGFEFRNHQSESNILKVPIYFTNPYASWEKGTNENTNGLIRQYFPKRSSMKGLTSEKIKGIEERLNTRPRKKLGFRTPMEASSTFERKIALKT